MNKAPDHNHRIFDLVSRIENVRRRIGSATTTQIADDLADIERDLDAMKIDFPNLSQDFSLMRPNDELFVRAFACDEATKQGLVNVRIRHIPAPVLLKLEDVIGYVPWHPKPTDQVKVIGYGQVVYTVLASTRTMAWLADDQESTMQARVDQLVRQ